MEAEITFTGENKDMERGDENMIQDEKKDLHIVSIVKDELNSRTEKPSPSIYMAPGILRNLSESSFIPRIVSIGPLHRDDKNLKAFEAEKVRCLANLLERIKDRSSEIILKECMDSMDISMKQIKACYVWPPETTYTDHEIAEMMVMDACFILEFISWRRKYEKKCPNGESSEDMSTNKLSYAIYYDLVLLENQIPFFVLKQIYDCTLCKCSDELPSLNDLIIEILEAVKLLDICVNKDNIPTKDPSHILSLLHEYYKPPSDIKPVSVSDFSFRSTVDLALSGVNIETENTPKWELQIEVKKGRFYPLLGSWSKHTLIVPKLYVGDFTGVILRNLIAYEQSYHTRNYITSYAFAMDMLVNDKEDVANLVKSKALDNDMGSNEEVAKMINSVCKNVIYEEYFYEEHCKTLDEYCNAYWPEHIAWFRRNKFNSPWSILGLLAGFILFSVAVTNTILSIISRIQ